MEIDRDCRYLKMAIEESRNCAPSDSSYCVGAVIVTTGGDIFKGYTHQTNASNHAEEEAIAAACRASADLSSAAIYSSMEPCSKRASKPKSCSELIIENGFSKVVFALKEPANFVKCEGVSMLKNAGIEVTELDALADEVRQINGHLLSSQ